MFGSKPPAPSDAVHVLKTTQGRELLSYCGQDLRGERELPGGTKPTCPVCKRRAPRP